MGWLRYILVMIPSHLVGRLTVNAKGFYEGNPQGKTCVFIATDAWAPQISGVSRTYAELTEALLELNYRVIVLTPQNFAIKLALTKEKHVWLWVPTALWRTQKILKTEQPDYIINAVEGPIGIGVIQACELLKLPFNTALHTRWDQYFAERYPWAKKPGSEVTKLLLKTFHERATHVNVRSQALKEAAHTELGLDLKKMSVWPGGVNAQVFKPQFKSQSSRQTFWSKKTDVNGQSCNLHPEQSVLLFVGRVSEEKNITAFLKADVPNSKKIIVGQGTAFKKLNRQYGRQSNIHFLGAESDSQKLAEYYSAADVFVFPSKTETFGLVAIESLACGTPIACLPELPIGAELDQAGVAICDPDLKTAITKALKLNRSQCRPFAVQHYTIQEVTKKLLASLAPAKAQSKKA